MRATTRKCFASASLILLAGSALTQPAWSGEVRIKRDQYGMPHVYANTVYDLFYGYGYAVAQDRLYSLDMARRTATGRVSEVLGKEFVDFDKKVRAEFWPASIEQQIADASEAQRQIVEGYAAGVNAWISRVRVNPGELLPHEYTVNGFEPTDWTSFDVTIIFVGSMLNRYGDFNTEIENAALLQALTDKHGAQTAQAMFETLLPRVVDSVPTTIPKGDWDPARHSATNLPLRPVKGASISPEVLDQIAPPPPDFVDEDGRVLPRSAWREASVKALSEQGPGALRLEAASNMAILGKAKVERADAILVNGPQFGWYRPAYTYSIGLHGAGFDVAGNTALAYPAIMFAHNGKISWGFTWGAGDQVDIFAETVNPKNVSQYRYNGAWKEMETRRETIQVKDGEPVTFTAYRTVHGPVVARDEKQAIAYAKKRGWSGGEFGNLMAWVELMKATDFDAFKVAIADSAVNVNAYYADARGNIGYVFGGFYPKRAEGDDGRLPVSGEGDMDWRGIMPFESNPQVFNPSNHMVLNWNNSPAEGFPNPDEWWYSWTPADRVSVLFDEFDAEERFTPEQVWSTMIGRVAFEDPNAAIFIPFIVKATADLPTDDNRRQLADTLAAWNHTLRDDNHDGKYDAPESAIMATWLSNILADTFAASLPLPYSKLYAATGYPDPEKPGGAGQNIQVGAKVLHRNLLGQGYDFFGGKSQEAVLSALAKTWDSLSAAMGPNPREWKAKVGVIRYSHKNFLGIPQTLAEHESQTPVAMNRGTETT